MKTVIFGVDFSVVHVLFIIPYTVPKQFEIQSTLDYPTTLASHGGIGEGGGWRGGGERGEERGGREISEKNG